MPMVYSVVPGATQTTNATGNTANDCFFVKPGTTRNVAIQAFYVRGHANALNTITGIGFRLEKWTTTASSAGTSITPFQKDPGMQNPKATAAYSNTTVTSGTGGPSLALAFGCSASGPGGWTAPNLDSLHVAEANAAHSFDIFNISAAASMVFELSAEIVE